MADAPAVVAVDAAVSAAAAGCCLPRHIGEGLRAAQNPSAWLRHSLAFATWVEPGPAMIGYVMIGTHDRDT